ncbi:MULTISPECIES: YbaB/EbfC family nucleoid-associated protein [unclassified Haematospirillum]|uniref:YbaB/EbfC family nucleoid-associated protein n=1 Tax=unclassified Haematospirillum TaxID=2622088 RepID=UPI00143BC7AA|nr:MULTISPECIES: YbaB/EbfC family nucleoid-associated protein [unclassified Haematospirillum]NKD55112.1 YbaB/EbfC family nucleoid-associated protein [Haematospirillum sp. H4890]NKD75365.1 YbaB/EbfC family nucleoid-associated protein [Haematospirillum sp. H4485]NKD87639.1 YbaB/EbfC family nucleoid-associated protein [Haematospirillum sp. 15-248]
MKNLGGLMKQAQMMQQKMAEVQAKLEEMEVTGVSGGGMVQLTLNGKGDMRRIVIDPAAIDPDDKGVLEDLVLAAHNDARQKVEQAMREEMQKVTGGLNLPAGMKLPF